LLFTASHGMGCAPSSPKQQAVQGALLCQDWPAFGQMAPKHYLAAADVPDDAHVHGLVSFQFACFGAGTPERDRFAKQQGGTPDTLAAKPFVAALPKRLLSHPNGGALACIGHVDRTWNYSFEPPGAGAQLLPFENAVGRILTGQPVGFAMKDFRERYASLSTTLSSLLEEQSYGGVVPDRELVSAWVERNDAEGYVVLGDPAARLRVADMK
jgi:hypothetical protein